MKNIATFESYLYEDNKKEKKSKGDYIKFNGNKLEFVENGKVTKTWKAVSGRTYYHWYVNPVIWKRRYTMKQEDWAKVKNEGPTPPGNYTLGVTQKRSTTGKWENDVQFIKGVVSKQTIYNLPKSPYVKEEPHEFSDKTPTSEVAWGDYRWALQPKKGTNTFGRGSFYLHGGSTPGSIGCIDLVTDSDDFAKYYEKWRSKTGNKTILIEVDYSTFDKDMNIDVDSQPFKMSSQVTKKDVDWYKQTNKEIIDTLGKEKIKVDPEVLKKRS
jgi:hypothetical protein